MIRLIDLLITEFEATWHRRPNLLFMNDFTYNLFHKEVEEMSERKWKRIIERGGVEIEITDNLISELSIKLK